MPWLTSTWTKLAAVASFILFLLLAVADIFRKGEKAGSSKVIETNTKAVQKAQDQANVVSNQVSQAPDGKAAQDLESKWTR